MALLLSSVRTNGDKEAAHGGLLIEKASVLSEQIETIEKHIAKLPGDHPALAILLTIPGAGPVLARTIAYEVGVIERLLLIASRSVVESSKSRKGRVLTLGPSSSRQRRLIYQLKRVVAYL